MLEQVDDCEQLSIFLDNEKSIFFSMGNSFLEFVSRYPIRNIIGHT